MCGIAGIFNYGDLDREVDQELLTRMTRKLVHRGPDAEGFFVQGPIGLGHRRLSILDLSATGSQPMHDPQSDQWISYNGELYNHRDFRGQAEARGQMYRGSSDTETLLYLLRDRGPEALAEAAGIFALAHWSPDERRLTLARDPLGVKQLYYHDNGRRILFASEIKALLECPEVEREISPQGLNEYLHFHTPCFENTFFKSIFQLRAGQFMTISPRAKKKEIYWKLAESKIQRRDPDTTVEELRELLANVVKQQLMADVPVGAFFSGGIDSSAIAGYITDTGMRPDLFGVHFSNQGVIDERPYQELAAKSLGLSVQLTTLDGSTFPEDIRRGLFFQDQPILGPAMLPMMHVSRLAASQVKVCLGGQAADELFGGYARYALTKPSTVLTGFVSGAIRRAFGARTPGAPSQVGGNLRRQLLEKKTLRRLTATAGNLFDWEKRYFDHFAPAPETLWASLLGEGMVDRKRCLKLFRETVAASPCSDSTAKAMHWDMQTYLTGLFHQDDRMSMASSLESRVPFADPRLVEFAFSMDFSLKFRGGASKWALRQAVANRLPAEVLNRRKAGFDTPIQFWLKEKHRGFVRDTLLSRQARERGLWNGHNVERFLDSVEHPMWTDVVWKILSVELWAQTFLDNSIAPRTARARENARSSSLVEASP